MSKTTSKKHIPLVDLSLQNQDLKKEIFNRLETIINESSYIHGPSVQKFEEEFANYCGTKHCIAVNTGTSALHLALQCLGIGPNDEVITVSMSFIATAWPILYLNATPVFVDIHPSRYTMDPIHLENAINENTKAIVPVHLYGQPAQMGDILKIANKYNIPVIEDAAQAAGTTYNGTKAGSMGDFGCFSFYPTKNLGAIGEGGAIVTNSDEFAVKLRQLRDHAQIERYLHNSIGYNYRLDSLQAAVLSIKLKHLDKWISIRREIASVYDDALQDTPYTRPSQFSDSFHSFHLYVLQSDNRDEVSKSLAEEGIHCGVHYPTPIHLQLPFKSFTGEKTELNVTESLAERCLSIPIYPGMARDDVDFVANSLKQLNAQSS